MIGNLSSRDGSVQTDPRHLFSASRSCLQQRIAAGFAAALHLESTPFSFDPCLTCMCICSSGASGGSGGTGGDCGRGGGLGEQGVKGTGQLESRAQKSLEGLL